MLTTDFVVLVVVTKRDFGSDMVFVMWKKVMVFVVFEKVVVEVHVLTDFVVLQRLFYNNLITH